MRNALLILLMLLIPSTGTKTRAGQGGTSPLMPPQSHAFGMSFEDWNVLWARRAIEVGLGGGTELPNTVGKVRLLPTVIGKGTHEFQVTVRPGTAFVIAPFFVFGETYNDPAIPDDNPADPFIDEILETTDIQTVLDGRILLDGTGAELARFRFGPVAFDDAIVYVEPQFRFLDPVTGDPISSTAALFVVGIGTVYHPLPVGKHTLVNVVHSAVFGDFHFTYHITVSPK
jgi:hypothetical protein